MSKISKWFFMLSKRLYKKPSFVALLLLVPLMLFAFSFAAKEEGGFVRVVLAKADNDEISEEIINELISEDSLIQFTKADSEEEAVEQVKSGGADEAWVFKANLKDNLNKFLKEDDSHAVSVYTKEQNVTVRLAREKLTSVLYKHCAKSYYIDYVRSRFSDLDNLSDEKLSVYFEKASIDESLFVFKNPNSNIDNLKNTNYLTVPIRGLLAIFAVLCGMAATMYFKQDEIYGTFSFVKNSRKWLMEYACVITAVINVAAVLLLSLVISSLSVNIFKEILIMLLYVLCCAAFSVLLGTIFKRLNTYSAIIPLITVVFIGVCPIFFDFRNLYLLQMLFPPTYYVNSIYDGRYIAYMAIYTAVLVILNITLKNIKTIIAIKKAR